MDTVYRNKLTLHIPHFAYVGGKLEEIDHETLKQRIFLMLEIAGVESWYITAATGYYKGRVYPQELLTVFCDNATHSTVIGIFRRAFSVSKDELKQESFAYEQNSTLVVVPMGETEY